MFATRCLILLACWTLIQGVVAVPDVALEQPDLEDRRQEERGFGLQERHNHPELISSLLSVLTEEISTKGPKPTAPGGGGGTVPGGGGGTTAPGGGGGTVPGGGGGTTAPGGGGGTAPGGGGGTTVPGGGGGTTVPGGGGE